MTELKEGDIRTRVEFGLGKFKERFNGEDWEYHSIDGPAIIYEDHTERYYVYDYLFTKEEFYSKFSKLGKILND